MLLLIPGSSIMLQADAGVACIAVCSKRKLFFGAQEYFGLEEDLQGEYVWEYGSMPVRMVNSS